MQIIEIDHVNKMYGDRNVLNDISFHIEKGEIFGLLGPSGAGKTTIIKLLLGIIKNDAGNIKVFGCKPDNYNDKIYASFGIVLDYDGLYERLSCYNNLDLFGRIYQIKNRKKVIDELLLKVGLFDARNKMVSELSKGMRQRLAFARAILHSPSIIFLDEPTSGLDPTTALQIHSLMKELCEAGTTIFLTTHNMLEAQKMCNRLVLLNDGNIVESGSPEEICLKHRKKKKVDIELVTGKTLSIEFEQLTDTLSNLADCNLISRIHSNEPSIEDVFIELTGRTLS